MDVAGRVGRLRAAARRRRLRCAGRSVELTNVRYLTGFTGSAALLLVAPRRDRVRLRWPLPHPVRRPTARAAGVDARIEIVAADPDAVLLMSRALPGCSRLGLESQTVTWAQQLRWSAGPVHRRVSWSRPAAVVEELRLVKDAGEAARIRSACAIADEALARRATIGWPSRPPRSSSVWSSMPRCAGSGPRTSASRPSSRPVRTVRSPTTTRPVGASSRETWWSSTSAPCSTGTTRT